MLFSLVIALMVILLTAFWTYQGAFNAAVMFFLSVVSCVLAFGFYEPLHGLWAGTINDGIGPPLAFMLIFLASLLGLKLLADKVIPSPVRLNVILDRVGGGVCGLFTGLVVVGSALTAIQMLPLGGSVFGFERVRAAEGGVKTSNFWFNPDGFTVGLAGMLSNGRFGGGARLSEVKPDLLLDLYAARANPQPEERMFLPADAVQIKRYWYARQIDEVTQRVDGDRLEREFRAVEPIQPGMKFLVCRVRVDVSASKSGNEIRFRTGQFRVVGPPPAANASSGAAPQVHLACGLSDIYTHKAHGLTSITRAQSTRLVRFEPRTDFILGRAQTPAVALQKGRDENAVVTGYRFDVAFEVPETFEPWYLEFKRGARAELRKDLFSEEIPEDASIAGGRAEAPAAEPSKRPAASDAPPADAPSEDRPKVKVGEKQGGATHLANAIEAGTGVFSTLPLPLARDQVPSTGELIGNKLGECHIVVELPDDFEPTGDIREFDVPGGKRMVQVGSERTDPLSLFGRAVNYAAGAVGQTKITDANGNDYFAIGVYSIAPVEGRTIMELQYHPEAQMPERCLEQPRKVKRSHLNDAPEDQRRFGFLFLVDPGVKIVRFSSGAKPGGGQSLEIDVP